MYVGAWQELSLARAVVDPTGSEQRLQRFYDEWNEACRDKGEALATEELIWGPLFDRVLAAQASPISSVAVDLPGRMRPLAPVSPVRRSPVRRRPSQLDVTKAKVEQMRRLYTEPLRLQDPPLPASSLPAEAATKSEGVPSPDPGVAGVGVPRFVPYAEAEEFRGGHRRRPRPRPGSASEATATPPSRASRRDDDPGDALGFLLASPVRQPARPVIGGDYPLRPLDHTPEPLADPWREGPWVPDKAAPPPQHRLPALSMSGASPAQHPVAPRLPTREARALVDGATKEEWEEDVDDLLQWADSLG